MFALPTELRRNIKLGIHIQMYPYECWLRPIFPVRLQTSIFGTAKLNFRVRNGNGWTLCVKITDCMSTFRLTADMLRISASPYGLVSVDLSFRSVSRQVFSALQSLTSVFGMGTGGPFALKTLTRQSLPLLSLPRHRALGLVLSFLRST